MKSKRTKQIVLMSLAAVVVAAVGIIGILWKGYFYPNDEMGNPRNAIIQSAAPVSPSESHSEPPSENAAEGERRAERSEPQLQNAAERLALSLSPEQDARLLELINEGTPRELLKIHGVGKTRAEAIQAARPFESVAQLAGVHGVGEKTFASVIEYGKQLSERETVVAVTAPSRP